MRAIVICPNAALRQQFDEAAAQQKNLIIAKTLDSYPSLDTFARLVRVWAPETIFVSLENQEAAAALCRSMDAEFPDLQRIAIHSAPDPAAFRLALRVRVRELLIAPFQPAE